MSAKLFSDAPLSHADRAIQLVEDALSARGLDPSACRLEDGERRERRYALARGATEIIIQVSRPGGTLLEPQHGRLRIVAPISTLSAEPSAELSAFLLEENSKLVDVAFALAGREVQLVTERSVEDLDAPAVASALHTVGSAVERYEEVLAAKFGATTPASP